MCATSKVGQKATD